MRIFDIHPHTSVSQKSVLKSSEVFTLIFPRSAPVNFSKDFAHPSLVLPKSGRYRSNFSFVDSQR